MLEISHDRLYTLADVVAVALHGERVALAEETALLLQERRNEVTAFVQAEAKPAYGFNRGFGHNVDEAVPPDRLADLQRNLILSHAAGLGGYVDPAIVRAAVFLRAVSLARGCSGVRPRIVEALCDLLEHDVTPAVPAYGSVGASGDLAPMSHIAAVLLGEGEAFVGGAEVPVQAAVALKEAGLRPVGLEMKEGLALNNGVQFSTAAGILAHHVLEKLLKTAVVATAISTQVMLGADTPFSEALHALRPHPGAVKVAGWLRSLMADSPIREAHRPYDVDGRVQDPYNIRCAPQILGACLDVLEEAARTFEIEANSVTDNPLVLPDGKTGLHTHVVSGGHFHGMPVAFKLYGLLEVMGVVARLSNMRCARFVDQARNKGLGRDLKWPRMSAADSAVSSAMMVPEYASAALTNAIWGAAMPTHLLSISTDAGQEDHVSMSAGLAVRAWETLPRLAEVLAIELAFGAQAAAIRRHLPFIPSKTALTEAQALAVEPARAAYEAALHDALDEPGAFDVRTDVTLRFRWSEAQRELSEPCRRALSVVEEEFPPVLTDRYMSAELRALQRRADDGDVLAAVEADTPLED